LIFPAEQLRELVHALGSIGAEHVWLAGKSVSETQNLRAEFAGGPPLEISVSYSSLSAAASRLSGQVKAEIAGGNLILKAGRTKQSIGIRKAEPPVFEPVPEGTEIPLAKFKELVRFAAQGCADREGVGWQGCVRLNVLNGEMTAVGGDNSDGRLFLNSIPCPLSLPEILLPAGLIKAASALKGESVKIANSERKIVLTSGAVVLYSNKIAAEFPKLDAVLSAPAEFETEIDASEFREAVKNVSGPLAGENPSFTLGFKNEVLTVSGRGGQDEADVELSYEQTVPDAFDATPEKNFSLSCKPLSDFLTAAEGKLKLASLNSGPLRLTLGRKILMLSPKRS
jgi:DNA polymerase III sliding clamp (beta) subunit (PCNA family)